MEACDRIWRHVTGYEACDRVWKHVTGYGSMCLLQWEGQEGALMLEGVCNNSIRVHNVGHVYLLVWSS